MDEDPELQGLLGGVARWVEEYEVYRYGAGVGGGHVDHDAHVALSEELDDCRRTGIARATTRRC